LKSKKTKFSRLQTLEDLTINLLFNSVMSKFLKHEKNNFAEVSKNLGYRFEKDFVGLSK